MPRIGEFDPHLRPLIRLVLRGSHGREQTLDVRLDTGFDLSLAVPTSVIEALNLTYVKTRTMYIANGETSYFAEYRGRVMREGFERPIRILAKPGAALAGIALFSGYRMSLEVVGVGAILCAEITQPSSFSEHALFTYRRHARRAVRCRLDPVPDPDDRFEGAAVDAGPNLGAPIMFWGLRRK